MHHHHRRCLPFAVLTGAAIALGAVAARHGNAWQRVWLRAAIAGATWPTHRETRDRCARRLPRQTFASPEGHPATWRRWERGNGGDYTGVAELCFAVGVALDVRVCAQGSVKEQQVMRDCLSSWRAAMPTDASD
jgi:hypothetical protein